MSPSAPDPMGLPAASTPTTPPTTALLVKMQCLESKQTEYCEFAILRAVWDDGCEENKTFSQATPVADFTITITNPDAYGFFTSGKQYVVKLTEA